MKLTRRQFASRRVECSGCHEARSRARIDKHTRLCCDCRFSRMLRACDRVLRATFDFRGAKGVAA